MTLKLVWRKIRLYKRFELDIWGYFRFNLISNKQLKRLFKSWQTEKRDINRRKFTRYTYRIDEDQPSRIRKRQKRFFITHKISKLFYLTITDLQFKMIAKAASKKEGSWESNFILLVENRLIGMLYRFQVSLNIFDLRLFILKGLVLIDGNLKTYFNEPIPMFSILTFKNPESKRLHYDIVKRFRRGFLYFNVPRYMFVSYKLMFAFVYREPKRIDLAFPLKIIDVYRGADLQ